MIESVTKFITVPVNHSDVHGRDRRVAVSLPRVRWLERDPAPLPAPRPRMARDFLPPPLTPAEHPAVKPTPVQPSRIIGLDGFTERQRHVKELMDKGCSSAQIGREVGVTQSSARKIRRKVQSILASQVRPPFNNDLAGQPNAAENRQP